MEISDNLVCLYSGKVEERGGRYVVDVPEDELAIGDVDAGEVYRVALLATESSPDERESASETSTKRQSPESTTKRTRNGQQPPVEEGEQRTVDIEDIGEKGDGIARVERGYVVIVPDTREGERVTIEITDVRDNLGFAEVVEREAYYE